MSETRSRPEAEALLAHRDFVRGLAMKLVFGEHAADDVVQETWLAARTPDGTPGQDAECARHAGAHRAETSTDREGRYSIESLPPTVLNTIDAIVPGSYHVRSAAQEKPLEVRLDAGDVCEHDLVVRRAPRLYGTLRGPDGPLPGVVVRTLQWGSMREGWMAETEPARTARIRSRRAPDGTLSGSGRCA